MALDIDWLPATAVLTIAVVAVTAIRIVEHLSVARTRRRTREAIRSLDARE